MSNAINSGAAFLFSVSHPRKVGSAKLTGVWGPKKHAAGCVRVCMYGRVACVYDRGMHACVEGVLWACKVVVCARAACVLHG